jgi:hypothetical protein
MRHTWEKGGLLRRSTSSNADCGSKWRPRQRTTSHALSGGCGGRTCWSNCCSVTRSPRGREWRSRLASAPITPIVVVSPGAHRSGGSSLSGVGDRCGPAGLRRSSRRPTSPAPRGLPCHRCMTRSRSGGDGRGHAHLRRSSAGAAAPSTTAAITSSHAIDVLRGEHLA